MLWDPEVYQAKQQDRMDLEQMAFGFCKKDPAKVIPKFGVDV